ncbi:MAG: hypothetical protein GX358_11435 [candidate division WS1 bacterium]|nr:hypothetical protein [candidate division WS1 bacterium]
MKQSTVCLLVMCLSLVMVSTVSAKECSRAITAKMRANALANVERFEWAAARQRAAIAAAAPWLSRNDDELWEMATSQELPRDIHTNKEVGCPNCGDEITPYGNYPWKPVSEWKLQCPNCEQIYPKNDFWAFYKSALDEHGFFRRELGDQSLLFNAEHPDPNDPLHKLYVDDGYGLTDEKGIRHRFVAYYNSWIHWANIRTAISALANAYALTSETAYAHKAAVLLDRLADVYPDMDWAPFAALGFEHSDGGSGKGRIQGRIWEASIGQQAYAYDLIFDGIQEDTELVAFLSEKANRHNLGDKSSIDAICTNIEENLLITILEAVKGAQIYPNLGGRKVCVVTTATALDRPGVSEEWIDWCFSAEFPDGYSIPWLLTDGIDRDGMGKECGGYGLGWTYRMVNFPSLLAKYPEYTKHDLVAEFPKLKQCFLIEPRLLCLDAVFPPYGDSGSTGSWSSLGSATRFALGYQLYGDQRMADLAWRYADGKLERLRMADDIYEEDPDALANAIARVAQAREFKLQCQHLGRYGQLILQTEEPDAARGRAVWMVFGDGLGHRHADALNIGLYAKNIDMLPDLGYPEYCFSTWAKYPAWTANTISHNTLLVNDTRNRANTGGQITLFACQPPVRVSEVNAPGAYQNVEAYRRTVALVDVSDSDSYVLDVFRARGGSNHRLSYHGPAQTATVQGVALTAQPTGTFAGPDVGFAEFPGEGETLRTTSGFSYLYDVERSGGPVSSYYTVDWLAEDSRNRIKGGTEPHLRLHALTPADEVALASGDPPQNKAGNPRRLRYLIQSRLGENVASQFITVLEPYDTTPFINAVRVLEATHDADPNSVATVAVELADGTVDILISCEQRTRVQVEGGIDFDGRFGMIRLVNGQVRTIRMSDATLLTYGDIRLETDQPAYEGTVIAINADDCDDHRIALDPPLPQNEALVGQRIHFENAVAQDTTYEIKSLTPEGISTGEMTIIDGFQDRMDFSAGHKYLVNPGDRYTVPNHVSLDF